MPLNNTVTRSYEMVVNANGDQNIAKLLDSTFEFYVNATTIFQDVWMNIFGGYNPSYHDPEKKFPKNPELTALLFWFPVESPDSVARDFAVPATKIPALFARYFGEHDQEIVRHYATFQTTKDAIFVDRHRAFAEWNVKVGINSDELKTFFAMPLPIFGGDSDSVQSIRSWFSKWWGRGKKDDLGGKLTSFKAILDATGTWGFFAGMPRGEAAKKVLDILKLSSADQLAAVVTKKSGLYKTVFQWLQQPEKTVSEKEAKSFFKWLVDKFKTSNQQADENFGKGFCENLLRHLVSRIGVEYHQSKKSLLEQFSEPASSAMQRITATQSTSLNQFKRRLELYDVFKKYDKQNEYYQRLVAFKAADEKNRVYSKQITGLSDFFDYIRDGVDYETAMKDVRADWKRINPHFFQWLFDNHSEAIKSDDNLFAGLREAIIMWETEEKYLYLQLGWHRRVTVDSYSGLNFGVSRPAGMLVSRASRSVPGTHYVDKLRLQLFNGKDFELFEVSCAGKRAKREVFYRHETADKQVVRNTKFFNPESEKANLIKPILETSTTSLGMKLIRRGLWNRTQTPHYYLKLSPKLTYEPSVTTYMAPPPGTRFLAVDLGQRHAGAFAVIETALDGLPVLHKTAGVVNHIHLRERGIIEAPLVKEYGLIDALSDLGRDTTDEEFEWFDFVLSQIGCDYAIDRNFKKYILNLKFVAGRVKSKMYESCTDSMVNLFIELSKRSFGQRNVGSLTLARLETMNIIARTSSIILSHFENDTVSKIQQLIREKIMRIKIERAKVTAKGIIFTAQRLNCSHIVVEDLLNMKTDANNERFINRRLVDWTPIRVLRYLKMQQPLYGYHLVFTNPMDTSHINFTTREWQPRHYLLTISELRQKLTKWEEYHKNTMRRAETTAASKSKQRYAEALKQFFEKHGVKSFKELLDAGVTVSYVPYYQGYYSELEGKMVTEDIAAAADIGRRGVLMTSSPRKQKAEVTSNPVT